MKSPKRGKQPRPGAIVKHINIKRAVISILLALLGLLIFTLAYGYTYQAKTKVELQNTLKALELKQTELNKKSKESQDNLKQIQDLQKQLQAKRDAQTALAQSGSVAVVQAPRAVSGNHADWMAAAGIPSDQWASAEILISRESGWRPDAYNSSSGACSLVQALPCSKIGDDWQNPVTALRWGNGYVIARYGNWDNALVHSYNYGWY